MSPTPQQKKQLILAISLNDPALIPKSFKRVQGESKPVSAATQLPRENFAEWKELRPVAPAQFFSVEVCEGFLNVGFWGHDSFDKYQPDDAKTIERELYDIAEMAGDASSKGIIFNSRGYPLTRKLEGLLSYWDKSGIDFGLIQTEEDDISSPWLHQYCYPSKNVAQAALHWDDIYQESEAITLKTSAKRYGDTIFLHFVDLEETNEAYFQLMDELDHFFDGRDCSSVVIELDTIPELSMASFLSARLQRLGHIVTGYTSNAETRKSYNEDSDIDFSSYYTRREASRAMIPLRNTPTLTPPTGGWTYLKPSWDVKGRFFVFSPWHERPISNFSHTSGSAERLQRDLDKVCEQHEVLIDCSNAEPSYDFIETIEDTAKALDQEGRELIALTSRESFKKWRTSCIMPEVFINREQATRYLSRHVRIKGGDDHWQTIYSPTVHRTSSTVLVDQIDEPLEAEQWRLFRDELLSICDAGVNNLVISLSTPNIKNQRLRIIHIANKVRERGVNVHFSSPIRSARELLARHLRRERVHIWSDPGEALLYAEYQTEPPTGDTYWKTLHFEIDDRHNDLIVMSLKDMNMCKAVFSETSHALRKERFTDELHHLADAAVNIALHILPHQRKYVSSVMNEAFDMFSDEVQRYGYFYLVSDRSINRTLPDSLFSRVYTSTEELYDDYARGIR